LESEQNISIFFSAAHSVLLVHFLGLYNIKSIPLSRKRHIQHIHSRTKSLPVFYSKLFSYFLLFQRTLVLFISIGDPSLYSSNLTVSYILKRSTYQFFQPVQWDIFSLKAAFYMCQPRFFLISYFLVFFFIMCYCLL